MSFIKYNFFCSSTNAVQGWPVAEPSVQVCSWLGICFAPVIPVSSASIHLFPFLFIRILPHVAAFSMLEGFFCLFLIEFLDTSFGKTRPLSMWIQGTLFFKREGWFFFNNPITVSWRPHRFYSSSNCLAVLIYHLYQSSPWLFKTVHLMLLY